VIDAADIRHDDNKKLIDTKIEKYFRKNLQNFLSAPSDLYTREKGLEK
jgi:hypothetical protein